MYLKRSFSIFISNFNLVFKLLFYIAVVIVIMSAIGVSIFMPSYHTLVREIRDTEIIDNAKDAFGLLLKGNFEEYSLGYEALEASYNETANLIRLNLDKLYKIYIMIFVLAIVAKYLITLSFIPFIDVVNKFMHSDIESNVTNNFIENMKRSSVYSLFDLLIVVPIDLLIIFLVGGIVSILSSLLGIFTMPFAVALGISLFILRVNILAGWIPAIVYDDMPVLKALIHSLKTAKIRLQRTYMMFAMIAIFSMSFYMLFGISTLGLGYIIGIPMITLFFRVLELVTYYNINGNRYYLDHDTIVEPRL